MALPPPSKQPRLCAYCASPFKPDPRVGQRHRFCEQPECRRVSRQVTQAKWLSKPENFGYHTGDVGVERVREWRIANPTGRRDQRRRQKVRKRLSRAMSPVVNDRCFPAVTTIKSRR